MGTIATFCRRAPLPPLALVSAVSCALAGCAGVPTPYAGPQRATFLGANAQFVFLAGPRERDLQLDAMVRAGVTFVRDDAPWELVEPSPPIAGHHQYSWSVLDGVVEALAQRRLRWLPIADYSTTWASISPGYTFAPPARIDDYAAFAAALAARYGPDGAFWREHPSLAAVPVTQIELWNEPNATTFWQPSTNPAAYARLFAVASVAIRAANPAVTAVVGGLAPAGDTAFVRAMIDALPVVRGLIDAVGLHPYATDARGVQSIVAAMRHALNADGLSGASIFVTEVGWPVRGASAANVVSDATRAMDLALALRLAALSGCGVSAFAPYTWTTPQRDPGNSEDWYGLYGPDARPSRTAIALTDAATRLNLASRPPEGTTGPC
ncbi:MAG: hypothetical protein DLM63_04255 [Solirubrobacterales bacterium]|nr:MAG: hypothetical protein DLM63_04255 [Solirubrobacterales bacterium]